jgi:hypothetical protein
MKTVVVGFSRFFVKASVLNLPPRVLTNVLLPLLKGPVTKTTYLIASLAPG